MTVVKASNFITVNDNNACDGSFWKAPSLPESPPNRLWKLYKATGCVLSWLSTLSQSRDAFESKIFRMAFEESSAKAAERWNYSFHLASAAS